MGSGTILNTLFLALMCKFSMSITAAFLFLIRYNLILFYYIVFFEVISMNDFRDLSTASPAELTLTNRSYGARAKV